jgi:hypothetical protein
VYFQREGLLTIFVSGEQKLAFLIPNAVSKLKIKAFPA